MKTTHYLYIMATALLTFSACNNDDIITEVVEPSDNQESVEGFVGTIGDQLDILAEEDLDGQPSGTRATMDEKYGRFETWDTSDKISISDGTLMYTFQPDDDIINGANCSFVSKTGATFTDRGTDGTFYAFYPADAVLGWNGTTVSTMIYTEQKYEENVENSGVMGPYMAAVAQTTDGGSSAHFTFGHVCSVIDVDLSSFDGGTVVSVALCSNSKASLAGSMTYNASEKTAAVKTDDKITYSPNRQSDVVLVSDINLATPIVRFYVLPTKQTSGLTITVKTTDGNYYTKSSSTEVGTSAANEDYLKSLSGVGDNMLCKPYYKKYKFNKINNAKTNRWMSMIPGSTYFNLLSTPGSHNSATSSVNSAGKCQGETIAQQLENGVRAFDLRPGYTYSSTITTENLYIYHGILNTNVLYKDAIKAMVDFLQANPTEAITIIMAKEDGTPLLSSWTDYTNEMVTAINSIHNTYSSYFKVLDHSYYTMSDYRGKIFYGCRPNQNITGAVKVTNWPDNNSVTNYGVGVGNTCTACVEDAYNTSGDNKKTVVNVLLDLASANTDKSHMHYTFTSVANSITSSANTQNPAAATHIGTLTGPTGYVYGDFMGSSSYSGQTLLKAVIEQNAKYVYKNRTRCAAASASGDDTGVDISSDEYADGTTVFSREQ